MTLWRAAQDMTEYLNRDAGREMLHGRVVLELGAGLGLCSIFASHFARTVFATDGDAKSMERLRRNCDLNNGGGGGGGGKGGGGACGGSSGWRECWESRGFWFCRG